MDRLINYNEDLFIKALQNLNYEELKTILEALVNKINEMDEN